jgi:hypothetical protein
VSAEPPVAIRTRHLSRPGRRAIVIRDLADLHGPSSGAVTLPLWLYWSGPSPSFNLDDPFMQRWLYEIVLREASRPEDLTTHLNAATLTAEWPHLFLPPGVRQAWEEQHPALRTAAAPSP